MSAQRQITQGMIERAAQALWALNERAEEAADPLRGRPSNYKARPWSEADEYDRDDFSRRAYEALSAALSVASSGSGCSAKQVSSEGEQ